MELLSGESLPQPERTLSPHQRFELLLQRFERIIETLPDPVAGISVFIPASQFGVPAHVRLGINVEETSGIETVTPDVYLSARWGRLKDAADVADIGLSSANLGANGLSPRQAEAISILELSATYVEDQVFELGLK